MLVIGFIGFIFCFRGFQREILLLFFYSIKKFAVYKLLLLFMFVHKNSLAHICWLLLLLVRGYFTKIYENSYLPQNWVFRLRRLTSQNFKIFKNIKVGGKSFDGKYYEFIFCNPVIVVVLMFEEF